MSGRKPENLAGRLLLSSALVAASLVYIWWHRHSAPGPERAAVRKPTAMNASEPARGGEAMTTPARSKARAATAPIAPTIPISALASLRMYQPPPVQAPLPLVTGTPGAIAPGTHLKDGDYLSETEQYEWGDLQVKILVHGGRITGVQIVQYPDHRAESLRISRMASPLLASEVIKTQKARVDAVSSATDTSYVFGDAIASAIKKAVR